MAKMARPRLLGPATAVELVRLERNARRPPHEVRADQLVRLRRALTDARQAPFWAEHLAGVPPPDALDDLAAAPTIDKLALRPIAENDRLTTVPPSGTRTLRTSGTSGVPMQVLYSPRAAWWQGVLRLRSTRHRGLRLWDRTAATTLTSDFRGVRGVLGAAQRSRHVALPLDASDDELVALVSETDPAAVSGHPHLLVELGEALRGRVVPPAVHTHGETLTPETRAALRDLFGVEPLDGYGTAECGSVAWQCREADLYHVNHEAVVLEIVDDEHRPVGPDETGQIVLTSLWNPLMPFVRYRIGDAAAWATRPCRCGSMLPALTALSGRTFNWIVDADGQRVAPQRMWASLHLGEELLRGISRYRVRQDRDRRVIVEVVPGNDFTDEHVARWTASYRRLLGDVPIEIRAVDALVTRPGEKFEIISSDASPSRG